MRFVAAALVVAATTGCGIGDSSERLVTREEIMTAFAAGAEPLLLRWDFAGVKPDSPIDAIYHPVGYGETARSVAPFGVVRFDSVGAAAAHRDGVAALVDGTDTAVYVQKNVVLRIDPVTNGVRAARLVAVLDEL